MKTNCIIYQGPSRLNGKPIVAIVTGLKRDSSNPKVPFPQVYIFPDEPGVQASDRTFSTCGTCAMRAYCYVRNDALNGVQKAYAKGSYVEFDAKHRRSLANKGLRLCAFGDPSSLPEDLVAWLRDIIPQDMPWTAYTEEWETAPHLMSVAVASVHTLEDKRKANAMGWRTFRVVPSCACASRSGETDANCPICGGEGIDYRLTVLDPNERPCPAGAKVNCASCPHPCDGAGPGRSSQSWVIPAHGSHAKKFRQNYKSEV